MTELKLCIEKLNNRTVVTDSFFTSPLKLGFPASTNKNRLEVVLMMASAGLLCGDEHSYSITCNKSTNTLITDQSSTKIFDTGNGKAVKNIVISVAENAKLTYFPHSVIPFSNSTFEGKLTFNLSESSELIYTDIFACGRVGMGEQFRFKKYSNVVRVNVDTIPVWTDSCLLLPECFNLNSSVFFDGYTHMGTLYYYGTNEKYESLRKPFISDLPLKYNLRFGFSRAARGIIIRMLGTNSQDIEQCFKEIITYISL